MHIIESHNILNYVEIYTSELDSNLFEVEYELGYTFVSVVSGTRGMVVMHVCNLARTVLEGHYYFTCGSS